MELTVFNKAGEDTGKKVALMESIFGIQPNDHAIYLDVKQLLANKRQGTHKTKERAEVIGSRKKIKRQKGTGTARSGDIKSPIFRGGGRVFGPRPKDYRFKLNKKVKKLARYSALSYKAKEDAIKVLEDFSFEAPKTKNYMDIIQKLEVPNNKTLLVLTKPDRNIQLSSRNIPDTDVVTLAELNTYNIMKASTLLFVESSLNQLQEQA